MCLEIQKTPSSNVRRLPPVRDGYGIATPQASSVAIAHRDWCLLACRLPASIFQRNPLQAVSRNWYLIVSRVVVWRLMRLVPCAGQELSLPEIAAACGMTSHSTILDALQMMDMHLETLKSGGGFGGKVQRELEDKSEETPEEMTQDKNGRAA